MGFLDGLLGNASEIKIEDINKEFAHMLGQSEQIEKAYKLIRDLFIFTNKRLILMDKQGLTGKKLSITHIHIKVSPILASKQPVTLI